MTKKEIHRAINDAFDSFVKEKYPEYEVTGDCEGGRLQMLYTGKKKKQDAFMSDWDLDYHVSQHYVCSYNYQLNGDVEDDMNNFLDEQKRKYNI